MRALTVPELDLVSGGYSFSYVPDYEVIRDNARNHRDYIHQFNEQNSSINPDAPAGTEDMGFFEFLGWALDNPSTAIGWVADQLVGMGQAAAADAAAQMFADDVENFYYQLWNVPMQQAWGNR